MKRETRGRLRLERDLVKGTMEMKVNPRRVGPPPSPTPHVLHSVHGVKHRVPDVCLNVGTDVFDVFAMTLKGFKTS